MKTFLKKSLCASLDVLGFQNEIKRAYQEKRELKLLHELEETLRAAANDLEEMGSRNSQILTTLRFFTDNLVVGYHYIEGPKHALCHLLELLADFQLSMACKGFFIRGGVSDGTLASDERIVFGDSLVKAHELEAKSAMNPRVVLDPCFSDENNAALETCNFRLMRDVDGYIFVSYLAALIAPNFESSRPELRLDENRLMIHKGQVERFLEERRGDPHVWSKYLWAANYHNAFCDQVQRKQFRINESFLHAHPVGLVAAVAT